MVPIRHSGPGSALSSGNGLGLMLLVSLGIHLGVAVFFAVGAFHSTRRDLAPVYTVDLTSLPVHDPQAGRPDARPVPAPAAQEAGTTQVEPVPPPEPPKPQAEPAPIPEPAPEPKAVVKPQPQAEPKKAIQETPPRAKPERPASAKTAESYQETLSAIEKIRQNRERQQEAEDLGKILAALKTRDSRGGSSAPIGLPTARGTEAGVDEQTWIQAYLKESWNLSKYQVGRRRDLEARVQIAYDPRGGLLDYKIVDSSGDAAFDDSVRRAILKTKQLPFTPDRRIEVTAVFNLKDLMD